MYTEHKKQIIIGLIVLGLVLLIAAGVFYKVFRGGEETGQDTSNQAVSTAEPVDVALDFYNPWLEAAKSTSTNPYLSGLATERILSEQLRMRLLGTAGYLDTDIDPVLCQTTTPMRVTGRIVSQQENEVRVLVMAREKELTAQSVFTLKRLNDGWFIDDIQCSPGEFDIPREFTFEKEGYLLKRVPPPYNSELWHLVFEENGEKGHVVPLLFSAESSCVATDTSTSTCAPDAFTEAIKVHVYGQMTEAGATITRLEFLE